MNIRKIAELANCSPSTVSRVLSARECSIRISEKTKKRILEVCAQLDYQPSIHAARFFSKQAKMIGFLVAQESMFEDENLSKSLFNTCDELLKYNYRCLPLVNNQDFAASKEYINIFKRREVDGMIIWGAKDNHKFLAELTKQKYPFILLANKVKNYPAVYTNQAAATAELTQGCVENGAKRLAALMSDDGDSFQQRHRGFLQAAKNCKTKIILRHTLVSSEEAYAAAPELLAFKPDAIICGNDEMAVGIEKYCVEHGIRIPQDVMLAGGDNLRMSAFCQIPLTTFDQQAEQCARRAVQIMLNHLQNGEPLASQTSDAAIIWRETLKSH